MQNAVARHCRHFVDDSVIKDAVFPLCKPWACPAVGAVCHCGFQAQEEEMELEKEH